MTGADPLPRSLARTGPAPYLAVMLSRFAFRLAGRFWAVLLVLTIAVHAAAPVQAAPLQWRTGSAFSADTAEVALAPARNQQAVRLAIALPCPPRPQALPLVPAAVLQPNAPLRPNATGPPRGPAIRARPAAPRAPPVA